MQAIDHTTQVLSLQYNRKQPVIFNTYQAYLKDSHTRLLEDMERARREGYIFAAKLVSCGAGCFLLGLLAADSRHWGCVRQSQKCTVHTATLCELCKTDLILVNMCHVLICVL